MQAIYAGKKATLSIGNIKPIGEMPEGAIICNVEEVQYTSSHLGASMIFYCCCLELGVGRSADQRMRQGGVHQGSGCRASECCCAGEQKAGDRGAIARASGDYAIVVAHNPEAGITRIKLPSGSKKVCVWPPQHCNHSMPVVVSGSLLLPSPCWRAKSPTTQTGGAPVCNSIVHAIACLRPVEPLIADALRAGDPQHMPRHDWPGGRGRQDREAHAEGRQCLPQVQGQEEQLAQGARLCPQCPLPGCSIVCSLILPVEAPSVSRALTPRSNSRELSTGMGSVKYSVSDGAPKQQEQQRQNARHVAQCMW